MTKSELIAALAERQKHLAFADVELAVRSRDLLGQPFNILLVARVRPYVRTLADIGADHRRTLAAEELDGRLADPRRRAGDDRDLA